MPLQRFARFVFVIYCAVVGMVLVMLPWSPAWDQILALLHYPGLDPLESPWIRGAVTGFGLIHLVWSVHDLDLFLRETLPALDPSLLEAESTADPVPSAAPVQSTDPAPSTDPVVPSTDPAPSADPAESLLEADLPLGAAVSAAAVESDDQPRV